jgi:GH15 family glucan-1,4-alpha-glucosidase
MTQPPIEDYALIGDCRSAALVSRAGSIDWLCWPRFDSPSLFAALLGTTDNGHWLIAPHDPTHITSRRYLPGTLVLETTVTTASGTAALLDFMPPAGDGNHLIRLVRGISGTVALDLHLTLRFDYGTATPWVTRLPEGGLRAVAGPDQVTLRTPVPLVGKDFATIAAFTVTAGETLPFTLSHGASHLPPPVLVDPIAALGETEAFWSDWSARGTYHGRYEAAVQRSLVTLKALTYAPTGGMVAAPTTSLPEAHGGGRNWDYRYCWLRDTAMALDAFLHSGHVIEAHAWSDWLHRSAAGKPSDLRIMYGLAGERRLAEWEADWLPGYQGARPVRIGNGAADQLQIDVYGEMIAALSHARQRGLAPSANSWNLQVKLVEHLETIWHLPDEGIWETRGGRQHFTFSKLMAWLALDQTITSAERLSLPAPMPRWRALRSQIHAEICARGFNADRNSFTQCYDGSDLDASLLLLPRSGFLSPGDPRVIATIDAIAADLMEGGFVRRYRASDGLPDHEATFLPCSFWLAEAYARLGRQDAARILFDRLLTLTNDVGLLAEEYDPIQRRQMGNFPQALTHTALIAAALLIE